MVEKEQLYPYECDALTAYRQVPRVALLPSSIEQVQAAMEVCKELKLPVVARGAGTSLSGGIATPGRSFAELCQTKQDPRD